MKRSSPFSLFILSSIDVVEGGTEGGIEEFRESFFEELLDAVDDFDEIVESSDLFVVNEVLSVFDEEVLNVDSFVADNIFVASDLTAVVAELFVDVELLVDVLVEAAGVEVILLICDSTEALLTVTDAGFKVDSTADFSNIADAGREMLTGRSGIDEEVLNVDLFVVDEAFVASDLTAVAVEVFVDVELLVDVLVDAAGVEVILLICDSTEALLTVTDAGFKVDSTADFSNIADAVIFAAPVKLLGELLVELLDEALVLEETVVLPRFIEVATAGRIVADADDKTRAGCAVEEPVVEVFDVELLDEEGLLVVADAVLPRFIEVATVGRTAADDADDKTRAGCAVEELVVEVFDVELLDEEGLLVVVDAVLPRFIEVATVGRIVADADDKTRAGCAVEELVVEVFDVELLDEEGLLVAVDAVLPRFIDAATAGRIVADVTDDKTRAG